MDYAAKGEVNSHAVGLDTRVRTALKSILLHTLFLVQLYIYRYNPQIHFYNHVCYPNYWKKPLTRKQCFMFVMLTQKRLWICFRSGSDRKRAILLELFCSPSLWPRYIPNLGGLRQLLRRRRTWRIHGNVRRRRIFLLMGGTTIQGNYFYENKPGRVKLQPVACLLL